MDNVSRYLDLIVMNAAVLSGRCYRLSTSVVPVHTYSMLTVFKGTGTSIVTVFVIVECRVTLLNKIISILIFE
jgi:hypothetical protein